MFFRGNGWSLFLGNDDSFFPFFDMVAPFIILFSIFFIFLAAFLLFYFYKRKERSAMGSSREGRNGTRMGSPLSSSKSVYPFGCKLEDQPQCTYDDGTSLDGLGDDGRSFTQLDEQVKFDFEDRVDNIFLGKPLTVEREDFVRHGADFNPYFVDVYGPEDDLKVRLARFLDCPCYYLPPSGDVSDVVCFYEEQCKNGMKGYTPLLVGLDPQLYEYMCHVSDPSYTTGKVSGEQVRLFRKSLLGKRRRRSTGKNILLERMSSLGSVSVGPVSGELSVSHVYDFLWDPSTEKTRPFLLAMIPETDTWKLFAWAPCTGNLDLSVDEMMSVSCYWDDYYSAAPMAIVDMSTVFFRVRDMAMVKGCLAKVFCEHRAVCPELAYAKDLSSYSFMLYHFDIWTFRN